MNDREHNPDDALNVYVPGCWICLKCGFALSQQTLFVNSGEVGCTREQVTSLTGERCPNDDEPMRRVERGREAVPGIVTEAKRRRSTVSQEDHPSE